MPAAYMASCERHRHDQSPHPKKGCGRKAGEPCATALADVPPGSPAHVEEVFGGNQEGTLAQLKAKRVEAGAVNSRFLAQYAEREHVTFREIYVSDGFPDLAVIAHPRVPATTVERVRRALLGMAADPGAAPVLAQAQFKGFEPATARDYEGVRRTYRLIGQ